MNLADKLLAVPQRENAGSRTANRFNYQQVWAFNYMLDLLGTEVDFLLLMEFHDDIIVLDSASNPQYIDFYQIKTDNKPSRYIKTSFITKDASKYPDKMSIAQKMIDNYAKFKSNTKSIHLVSNKNFDFGELKCKVKSNERVAIRLDEISDEELVKLKKGMCQSCHLYKNNCNKECLKLIYFDVSFTDLVNYEETVMGRFVNSLNNMGIESSTSKIKSIFYTILGEIKRSNNWEMQPQSISELIQRKSISKEDFRGWIDKLRVDMPDDTWNEIKSDLLHDGLTSIEVMKIGKQWKKYHIDLMNVENIALQKIRDQVQKLISEKSFDSSKEYIKYVYSVINEQSDVKILSKEYVYAIIVKELFS